MRQTFRLAAALLASTAVAPYALGQSNPTLGANTKLGLSGLVKGNGVGAAVSAATATDITTTLGYTPSVLNTSSLTLNVPSQYPTVQAALNALRSQVIGPGVTATIQVAAGRYGSLPTITATQPYGDSIKIVGAPTSTQAIGAANVTSGQAGAWKVALTGLSSTAAIQAGDLVDVEATTGSTPRKELHEGAWVVVSVDSATQITVLNTSFNYQPPSGVAATLRVYPTQLAFTAGGIYADRLAQISNVALQGPGNSSAGFGIWARPNTSNYQLGSVGVGPYVAVSGFTDNVRANYGGYVTASLVWSSSATNNGFLARDLGGIACNANCTASGNGTIAPPGGGNGLLSQNTSSAYVINFRSFGNWGHGEFARTDGNILNDNGGPGLAVGNIDGYVAAVGGYLQNEGGNASYNTTDGYYAEGGTMDFASAYSANNGGNGYNVIANGYGIGISAAAASNALDAFRVQGGGNIFAAGSNATGVTAPGLAYDVVDAGTINSTGAVGATTSNGWLTYSPTIACASGSATFAAPSARFFLQSNKVTCFAVEITTTASSSCQYPYFSLPTTNVSKFNASASDLDTGTVIKSGAVAAGNGNNNINVATVPANADYLVNGCYESR